MQGPPWSSSRCGTRLWYRAPCHRPLCWGAAEGPTHTPSRSLHHRCSPHSGPAGSSGPARTALSTGSRGSEPPSGHRGAADRTGWHWAGGGVHSAREAPRSHRPQTPGGSAAGGAGCRGHRSGCRTSTRLPPSMGGMEDHGRAPGGLGAWHPWHSCVHPAPPLTHEKCRGRQGAKHLFRRMLSTPSVPLASSIQLETPGVSWDGVEHASGGSAPDAGGCLGSGQGGASKRVGAPPSKSLAGVGGSGALGWCSQGLEEVDIHRLGRRAFG